MGRLEALRRAPQDSLSRAAGVGLAVGVMGAFAFYVPALNPIAHIASPWIFVAVLVARGRALPVSVGRAVAALVASVVGFYLGQWVGYRIKWGNWLDAPLSQAWLWIVLAVMAGVVLGFLGHRARGDQTWRSAWAAGAAVALIVADGLVRWHDRGLDIGAVASLATAALTVGILQPNGTVYAIGTAAVLVLPAILVIVALTYL